MKKLKINILNILKSSTRLTFLVGAGCSIDPPSNLKSAKEMMETIIKYSCPKPEIPKINEIKELRFEELIQLFRDMIDADLRVLNYYGECTKPNLQHFFLADMIKRNNFVITTNFDSLIEHALLKSGIPRQNIIPVITEEDFKRFNDPYKLVGESQYPIFKLHGSAKDDISTLKRSQDIKNSLISTLDALGSHKKGTNLLSVEYYKKPVLEKACNGRSLVVMGYSGGDDFDIIPALKTLKDIKNIYWINYSKNKYKVDELYEIEEEDFNLSKMSEDIDSILANLKIANTSTKVYKIDINTSILVKEIVSEEYNLGIEKFNLTPKQWLNTKIKNPSQIIKLGFACKIYYRFNKLNDFLRCSKELLRISKVENEKLYIAEGYNNVGKGYMALYSFSEAIEFYHKALNRYIDLNYSEGIMNIYNSFAYIYNEKGYYNKSTYFYKRVINILNSTSKNEFMKSLTLNNLAGIYCQLGQFKKAHDLYNESLRIAESIGNIEGIATNLDNLGAIFYRKGKIKEALTHFNKAKEIFNILFDVRGEIGCNNKIGKIYYDQGDFENARELWEMNLNSAKKINDVSSMITAYNNLAILKFKKGKKDDAETLLEKVIKLSKKMGKMGKIETLLNISSFNALEGHYETALKIVENAHQISNNFDNKIGIASSLKKKGEIYDLMNEPEKALIYYEDSLKISQEYEFLDIEMFCHNQIGMILEKSGDFEKAIIHLKEAIIIAQKVNFIEFLAVVNKNLGIIFKKMEKCLDAYSQFNKAFKLFKRLSNIEQQINCLKILIQISIGEERFQEALANYNNLIEILYKSKKFSQLGKYFYNKAKILYKLKKYSLSSIYFRKSLDYHDDMNNATKKYIYKKLADIAILSNKYTR